METEVTLDFVRTFARLIGIVELVLIWIVIWMNKIVFRSMYKLRLEELKSRWFEFVSNPKTENAVTAETFDLILGTLNRNIKLADWITVTFVLSLAREGWRLKRKGVDMSKTLFVDSSPMVQEEVRYIQNQMTWALHRFLTSQSVVYALYSWGHWIVWKMKASSDGKYPKTIDEVRRQNLQDGGSFGMLAS